VASKQHYITVQWTSHLYYNTTALESVFMGQMIPQKLLTEEVKALLVAVMCCFRLHRVAAAAEGRTQPLLLAPLSPKLWGFMDVPLAVGSSGAGEGGPPPRLLK
jgi:hypothetical protein